MWLFELLHVWMKFLRQNLTNIFARSENFVENSLGNIRKTFWNDFRENCASLPCRI
jgi:hypothetical protein